MLWQLSFRGSFIIKDVLAVKVVALDAARDYFLKLLAQQDGWGDKLSSTAFPGRC